MSLVLCFMHMSSCIDVASLLLNLFLLIRMLFASFSGLDFSLISICFCFVKEFLYVKCWWFVFLKLVTFKTILYTFRPLYFLWYSTISLNCFNNHFSIVSLTVVRIFPFIPLYRFSWLHLNLLFYFINRMIDLARLK